MQKKDIVTLDIMKVLEQMNIDKERYITLSSNNPYELNPVISESVQPAQKQ